MILEDWIFGQWKVCSVTKFTQRVSVYAKVSPRCMVGSLRAVLNVPKTRFARQAIVLQFPSWNIKNRFNFIIQDESQDLYGSKEINKVYSVKTEGAHISKQWHLYATCWWCELGFEFVFASWETKPVSTLPNRLSSTAQSPAKRDHSRKQKAKLSTKSSLFAWVLKVANDKVFWFKLAIEKLLTMKSN